MKFITRQEFFDKIDIQSKGSTNDMHWKKSRWEYHSVASAILQLVAPDSVLELGTMGIKLSESSDDMDFPVTDFWPVNSPTYLHNAKVTPWPICDKSYDVFVALRVFHHLYPVQKQCFDEAKRISRGVLLSLPINYSHSSTSVTMSIDDLKKINNDIPPSVAVQTTDEFVFYWSEKDFG